MIAVIARVTVFLCCTTKSTKNCSVTTKTKITQIVSVVTKTKTAQTISATAKTKTTQTILAKQRKKNRKTKKKTPRNVSGKTKSKRTKTVSARTKTKTKTTKQHKLFRSQQNNAVKKKGKKYNTTVTKGKNYKRIMHANTLLIQCIFWTPFIILILSSHKYYLPSQACTLSKHSVGNK